MTHKIFTEETYKKVKFEDYYQKFDTVSDIIATEDYKEFYSHFYIFDRFELDIKIHETKEEVEAYSVKRQYEELEKCQKSFSYFCHKYVKILHPIYGTIPFLPYAYQRRSVKEFGKFRFSMVKKFRQGGLTTVAAIWGLWKCLFKPDQRIFLLSKTDREAMSAGENVKIALEYLPKWLCNERNTELSKHEKLFNDTGSKICFYTPEAARGKAASLIIIDEAAFIADMHAHWEAMYPVISTGGDIVVISTVNGLGNWYEEWYHAAQEGKNFFHIVDLHYSEHPQYANPEWSKTARANLGERKWKQEFEGNFLGSGETYISTEILERIAEVTKNNEPSRVLFQKWLSFNEDPNLENIENGALWIWREPLDGHEYIMGVDCAEGVGQGGDNSAFQILDMSTLEQVGEFYSNTVPPHTFAQIIHQIAIYYNTALVVVENMSTGGAVLSNLQHDLAYENLYYDEKGGKNQRPGIKIGPANRTIYLEALQQRLITDTLKINSKRLVKELNTFMFDPRKKRAEAQKKKHDDAIMSMCFAILIRESLSRSIPVGATMPQEMVKIFKSAAYEEIRAEIMRGTQEDLITLGSNDHILDPDSADVMPAVSFNLRRKNDRLISEFGW